MPWPRPSHVGFSDIRYVICVSAKTKTRSKKSSSGATRFSEESSGSSTASAPRSSTTLIGTPDYRRRP